MKKENDIRVEMYRVVGDCALFVKVDYMDKEAQEHTGLMMLDTGSNLNILSEEMADSIGILCKQEGKSANILTVTGDAVSLSFVRFSFAMGGVQFHEKFCINEKQIPQINGDIPVIGILGNVFMQQYCLAIDYSDFTLHTSNVSPESLAISDCDFFFPMDIGLKYFGLPVLSIKLGDKELVAMADTGATNNTISVLSLSDGDFHCEYLGSTDSISGLTGSIEVKDAVLSFDLQTLKEDDENSIHRKDEFKVYPHYLIETKEGKCDENGVQLPHIEALIGCPFMANEAWVLDFGVNVIYKRAPQEQVSDKR